jgi:hypothetical protein
MMNQILVKLGLGDGANNGTADSRRRHIRYDNLNADVEISGRAYAVRDWGLGGFSFDTPPDARLMAGDRVRVSMRFRFPHDTVTVEREARILRTGRNGVAAAFPTLSHDDKRGFDRVIDGIHAQDFLSSQSTITRGRATHG